MARIQKLTRKITKSPLIIFTMLLRRKLDARLRKDTTRALQLFYQSTSSSFQNPDSEEMDLALEEVQLTSVSDLDYGLKELQKEFAVQEFRKTGYENTSSCQLNIPVQVEAF